MCGACANWPVKPYELALFGAAAGAYMYAPAGAQGHAGLFIAVAASLGVASILYRRGVPGRTYTDSATNPKK